MVLLHISWLNVVLAIFIMPIIENYKALFTRKFFLCLGLVFGQKIVLPARKLFPEFEKFPVSLRFMASNTLYAPAIKGISSPSKPSIYGNFTNGSEEEH